MNPCDPDILTSFVDGALSEAEQRRIMAHLEACPPCADTVRAHRDIKRRLATSATLMTVPAGLSSRVSSALDKVSAGTGNGAGGAGSAGSAGSVAKFGLPLGAVALITAGGLWFSQPLWRPEPFDARALMWHHRDAINPPASASFRTSDAGAGRQWIQDRLNQPSTAPALSARLRGVGVCRVDDVPSAIWMYDAGRPVSLIEIYRKGSLPAWSPAPPNAGATPGCPAGLRAGNYGGYNAVIWQSGGRTYALVSDLPKDRLIQLLEKSP